MIHAYKIIIYRLWYPTRHIHYMSFNTMFSAIYDHVVPFGDPFINAYTVGVGILFNLMVNFSEYFTPNWLKHQLVWKVNDDIDN